MTKKKTRGRNYTQREVAQILGTSIMVSGKLAERFRQSLDPGDLAGNFSTGEKIREFGQKCNRLGYVVFERGSGEKFADAQKRHRDRVVALSQELREKYKEMSGTRLIFQDNIMYSSQIFKHN